MLILNILLVKKSMGFNLRIRNCRRGISAIMVSLIILAVSLGMAVTYAAMMMGWFGGASAIVRVDTTDTRVILDPNTGYTKFQLVIRNLGTATLKITNIQLDTDSGGAFIVFEQPMKFHIKKDTTTYIASNGSIYGSSSSVTVTADGVLIIPPGQTATLYTGISDGRPHWSINKGYRATIFYEGGVMIIKYVVENY